MSSGDRRTFRVADFGPNDILTSDDIGSRRVKVETDHAQTAFGEMKVESVSPITQISAQYGLLSNVLTTLDNNASGQGSIVDNKFTCDTGTAPDGLSSILSLRQLAYRAGQGAMARFTALFDEPVADSIQAAGLITAENSFVFAYVGTEFGILHARDGMDELQELTLTVPAGIGDQATVTIDGNPYIVVLSGIGNIEGDAYELAQGLSLQVPNYLFTSNGGEVVAQSVLPAPQGQFNYSSDGSSSGSWVQVVAGLEPIQTFIPQSQWNRDTKEDIKPQFGNVYQIQFQYLGFGAIDFFVEDMTTGRFVLVHKIEFSNGNVTPSVSNPTFRVGWLARNEGNTSNVRVQGSSAALFIEGSIVRDVPPRSDSVDQLAVGTEQTNIMSIRNRTSFGGKVNRAEIFPQIVAASSQTNKAAVFKIILNPTFDEPVNFEYVEKDGSIAEVTREKVGVSGGREIGTVSVSNSGGSQTIQLNQTISQPTAIYPGIVVTLAAMVLSGQAADCQGSVTWQEDL